MITDDPLLVVITGATASGKTGLSVELALKLETCIISADSRQFYREMKIGTAAPDPGQLAAVPHHLIGHLSIHDEYNVSRYENDVMEMLPGLFNQFGTVLLTGGSGLYIKAVTEGIDALPDPDPALRQSLKDKLQSEGIVALQQQLMQLDPVHCRKVDLRNPSRLIRALEVCLTCGIPYSSLLQQQPKKRPFRILEFILDVPMSELDRRIHSRLDNMMEAGFLAEAEGLFPYRHLNALNTVGYKELFSVIEGRMTLPDAIQKIRTNTRRYARRQLTWLRSRNQAIRVNTLQEIISNIYSHA